MYTSVLMVKFLGTSLWLYKQQDMKNVQYTNNNIHTLHNIHIYTIYNRQLYTIYNTQNSIIYT